MNKEEILEKLNLDYEVIATIDLDQIYAVPEYNRKIWFNKCLKDIHKPKYSDRQRVVFTLSYVNQSSDEILMQLQKRINDIDISNFFVIVVVNTEHQKNYYTSTVLPRSTDSVPLSVIVANFDSSQLTVVDEVSAEKHYNYNSTNPVKISLDTVGERERFLLTQSKRFCMYPWIHIHAYPTGQAHVCCHAEMDYPIGNCRQDEIKDIWNQAPMRGIRLKMLNEEPVSACTRCYEQEAAGFFSGRLSANKHHGHHISRVNLTRDNGTLDQMELTYWDIRFSNLCNLSCRSCGHIFSSSWYQDQIHLAGSEWKKNNKPLNYAGRYETDMWEQLEPHLDYVEQIYFAGGEPLLMEEHYNILEELVRRERFDVRLIYNTNFTHTQLKDRSVFEYWKLFQSVAVGASLDDMGQRAEYIRKGTKWDDVVRNRVEMLKVCPKVDFYISPTLSIMNADHLPTFHRHWVEGGLIRAQDLNVNILQDPAYYRIDIATPQYKDRLREKYLKHLEWLRPQDPLQRATVGFESAIKFMDATDNSHLLPEFWSRTHALDALRNEDILHVLPELIRLK